MDATKLDIALMTIPFDLACTLMAFGAGRAFIWTGTPPKSTEEFFFNLGRTACQMADQAWEKEINRVGVRRHPR